MKSIYFIAIIALFLTSIVLADPPKPDWPPRFKTGFRETRQHWGHIEVASGDFYADYVSLNERFSFFEPIPSVYLYDFVNKTAYHYYAADNNCTNYPITFSMRLPDFVFFKYIGRVTIDNIVCDQWEETNNHGTIEYFDNAANYYPVRMITNFHDYVITVDYFDFDPTYYDPTIFWVPGQCR
eukprot:TRINITY_DN104_c3_g3_i1.p1 TRINITY_DN104_c3_g3~~TRINITY_DN104_c3_g3_i1.p1  ORF type:complete len:182 (-),score=58.43 TRINITY_DN104_c3_g3_i1:249-794(-)